MHSGQNTVSLFVSTIQRHDALNQCWFNAVPVSQMLGQHESVIGATSRNSSKSRSGHHSSPPPHTQSLPCPLSGSKLAQCFFDVGPLSPTPVQHHTNIWSKIYLVCCLCPALIQHWPNVVLFVGCATLVQHISNIGTRYCVYWHVPAWMINDLRLF